jgi:hydroxymethylpyrimidine/phosphomethylpyrimidine kinase
VLEVARLFRETDLPSPVVDPVMISSSGQRLMEVDALEVLIRELLPVARLITPNVPEAEQLTGIQITSEAKMLEAAAIIRGLGARAVLIKGGHLGQEVGGIRQEAASSKQKAEGSRQVAETQELAETFAPLPESIDVLDNEGRVTVFRERRLTGGGLHGSGCILSAAIAAGLGKGMALEDSVRDAKKFVWEAIRNASMRMP